MSPATNLVLAGLICLTAVVLFWPQRGLVPKWLRGRRATERVLIEDALKHFYDCEYERLHATTTSLAGALEIGRDRAAALSERLETMELIRADKGGFRLTDRGRTYALRVIRTHRLWESYLAERTGVHEAEWHHSADQKEHTLTADQVEHISAQLGNPSFDPHGAPIPRADGAMPGMRGVPLSALKSGITARIVHVEDEPDTVYAQLIAARLFPGVTVHVLETGSDRIRIDAEFQEHVLAPVVAANLSVEPISDIAEFDAPDAQLSSLSVGQEATVVDISRACRGVERRRLLDLGVVPGTVIRAELNSASGDPKAYRIRGAMIALRKAQADLIHVKSVVSQTPAP
jgi:DtxR family Mn-dependent transcriptional regulator